MEARSPASVLAALDSGSSAVDSTKTRPTDLRAAERRLAAGEPAELGNTGSREPRSCGTLIAERLAAAARRPQPGRRLTRLGRADRSLAGLRRSSHQRAPVLPFWLLVASVALCSSLAACQSSRPETEQPSARTEDPARAVTQFVKKYLPYLKQVSEDSLSSSTVAELTNGLTTRAAEQQIGSAATVAAAAAAAAAEVAETAATAAAAAAATEATGTTETSQDELAAAGDDDDDAKDCKGISAVPAAKGAHLSDAQRLVNLQTCLQKSLKRRLKSATRDSLDVFDRLSLTGGCASSLLALMAGLSQTKSFAFKFLDASAKVPSGMMYGLLSDFGDFDQCLSIRSDPSVAPELEQEEGTFSGKYCLLNARVNFRIRLAANASAPDGILEDGVLWDELVRKYWTSGSSKSFQVGMCFPSRCTNDDLNQIYNYLADSYNLRGEIASCQSASDLIRQHRPDALQLFIIYAFYALLATTLAATLVDRYQLARSLQANLQVRAGKGSAAGELEPGKGPVQCALAKAAAACEILECFSIARNWTTFTWPEPGASGDKCARHDDPSCAAYRSSLMEHNSLGGQPELGAKLESKAGRPEVKLPGSDQPAVSGPVDHRPLSHLSGLRLFVIVWITMGYSFLYPSANNYQHYRSIINMKITRDSVWFAITNFTLGIDMLLYMAGLVFVYKLGSRSLAHATELQRPATGGQPEAAKVLCSLVRKILRFWPTYLALIGFAIVVPLLGDGPMWPEMVSGKLGAACRKNWWANLLFINNYQGESEICLPSSWFVSVLMQLFCIGSAIIVLERKFGHRLAVGTLSALLAVSALYSFYFSYAYQVRAPVIRMDESFVMEMDANIWSLYTSSLNNLGPFLVGMLGGYILLGSLKGAQKCNKIPEDSGPAERVPAPTASSVPGGWLARTACSLFVGSLAVLVLSSVFHENYSKLASSFYWSFHRIAWSIVTGYLVHKCAVGRWTLLKDFLSLATFMPVSRLTFVAYLLYPAFTYIHSGLVRDGLHVSIYNMFSIYLTRLIMTFATALAIHLLIELPLNTIEARYISEWFPAMEFCWYSQQRRARKRSSSADIRNHLILRAKNSAHVAIQFGEACASKQQEHLSRQANGVAD